MLISASAAASSIVLPRHFADAAVYTWNNSGTAWETSTDWNPNTVPTAADVASFDPTVTTAAINNPTINAADSALSLNLNNNFLGGTYTFTGAGALTVGGAGSTGISVRGFGTQTINGPTLAGSSSSNPLTFNVGNDAGLTLAGTSRVTANGGTVTINGGTMTLDNTANATAKLSGNSIVINSSGVFSVVGNSAATSLSLGALNGTGNTFSGLNVVSLTPGAGGVTANFTNTGSLRPGTRSAYQFATTSGNLGDAAGGRILFGGVPFLGAGSLFGNSNSATAQTVGFAVVKDANGSNWATYSSTAGVGVVSVTSGSAPAAAAPVTATTASDLQSSTNVKNIQFNPAANATVTPSAVAAASLRISPAGSGAVLAMGANTLTTNALMVDGTSDFSITGTGAFAAGGTRYIYVNNSNTTLSTSLVVDSGANPTIFAGPGVVELTGVASQNTNTDTSRFTIAGGVVRGNNTEIGFATSTTAGVISFGGGVLEMKSGSNGTGAGADFTRALNTTAGGITWGQGSTAEIGSGGFSAFGNAASVNIGGASGSLFWASTANFVADGYALKFGSVKSNAVLTFQNPIGLDGGTAGIYAAREVNVTGGVGGDSTVLSGIISGSATTDLIKSGSGTLRLTATNTYAGRTFIQGGVLLANNATSSLGTGRTIVQSGATLAGGPTVTTAGATGGEVLLNGGAISAGTGTAAASTIGTLYIGNATTQAPLSTAAASTYTAKVDGRQTLAATGQTPNSGSGTIYTGASDELVMSGLSLSGNLVINPLLLSTGNFTAGSQYDLVIADATGSSTAFSDRIGQITLAVTSDAGGIYSLDYAPDGSGGQDLLLDYNVTATPEPTSMLFLGTTIAPLLLSRRRRRQSL